MAIMSEDVLLYAYRNEPKSTLPCMQKEYNDINIGNNKRNKMRNTTNASKHTKYMITGVPECSLTYILRRYFQSKNVVIQTMHTWHHCSQIITIKFTISCTEVKFKWRVFAYKVSNNDTKISSKKHIARSIKATFGFFVGFVWTPGLIQRFRAQGHQVTCCGIFNYDNNSCSLRVIMAIANIVKLYRKHLNNGINISCIRQANLIKYIF